jgi:preprotein translocase subunit SecB
MSMQPTPESAPAEQNSPHLRVLAQYVKELTFKNPTAAGITQGYEAQPMIDMGVEVKSRPMGDSGDAYEVDLRINVEAKRDDKEMFNIDLTYSGIFQFMNVQSNDVEPLLWIECPRLLFPFSRQILAEITREGGYPPLLINPIDFTPLYMAELRDREAARDGDGGDGGASSVPLG